MGTDRCHGRRDGGRDRHIGDHHVGNDHDRRHHIRLDDDRGAVGNDAERKSLYAAAQRLAERDARTGYGQSVPAGVAADTAVEHELDPAGLPGRRRGIADAAALQHDAVDDAAEPARHRDRQSAMHARPGRDAVGKALLVIYLGPQEPIPRAGVLSK
jgi:hypothetical protein